MLFRKTTIGLFFTALLLVGVAVPISTSVHASQADEQRRDLERYPAYQKKLQNLLKSKQITQKQYDTLNNKAINDQVQLNTERALLNNYRNNPPTNPEDQRRMEALQKSVAERRANLSKDPSQQAKDLKSKTDRAPSIQGSSSSAKPKTSSKPGAKASPSATPSNQILQGGEKVIIPTLKKNALLPGKAVASNDFKNYYVDSLGTRIIKLLSSIVAVASLLFIIYGSYHLLNPLSEDKYESAKKIIYGALVGLFLSLFAYAIVSIIASIRFS